jgi:hypothetical protein
MACFLVASKYEDIYPPDTKELCYLCENAYSKEEILRVEADILSLFNFELIFTSCFDILEQFFFTLNVHDFQTQQISIFILKLFLFQSHLSKYNAYKLSAFALELAHRAQGVSNMKVYGLVSKEESDLLMDKLRRIYRRSIEDGLGALRMIEKERL